MTPEGSHVVDLGGIVPEAQHDALRSFRGSKEIAVPQGWTVEAASVTDANPFAAGVEVRYITPAGPDEKSLILRRPAAAVMATRTNPESAEREMLVVRQIRHGFGGTLLELPGGMAKKNQTMGHAAVDELREEAGVVVTLDDIGEPHVLHRDPARSPGLEVHRYHVEVSGDVATTAPVVEDGEHIVEAAWMPVSVLREMVLAGKINDLALEAAIGFDGLRELQELKRRMGELALAAPNQAGVSDGAQGFLAGWRARLRNGLHHVTGRSSMAGLVGRNAEQRRSNSWLYLLAAVTGVVATAAAMWFFDRRNPGSSSTVTDMLPKRAPTPQPEIVAPPLPPEPTTYSEAALTVSPGESWSDTIREVVPGITDAQNARLLNEISPQLLEIPSRTGESIAYAGAPGGLGINESDGTMPSKALELIRSQALRDGLRVK
jgi:8-oxo-dGTP pyrophosphatase MutT (NUDIX family)